MEKTLFLLAVLLAGARSELSVTHVKPLISNSQYNDIRNNAHNVLSKLNDSYYSPNWMRWNIAYAASDDKTKQMMNQIAKVIDYGNLLDFCDANNSKLRTFVDTATSLAVTTSINQEAQMGSQTLDTAKMGVELFSDAQNNYSEHFIDFAVMMSKGAITADHKALLLSILPLAMRCKGGVTGALNSQPAFGDMIFYARVEKEVSGAEKEEYNDAELSAQSVCERSAIPTMSRGDRNQLADSIQTFRGGATMSLTGGDAIGHFIIALRA